MKKISVLVVLACGAMQAQTVSTQITAGEPNDKNLVYVTPGLAMAGAAPGAIGFMAHEFSVSGKPVTGAPYSADQVTEHVQTLADGNRIVNTTTTKVYRDSQGRTRTEVNLPAPSGGAPPPAMVTIHDPVAKVTYLLNPENKTAQKMAALALQISDHNGQAVRTITLAQPPSPAGADAQQVVVGKAGVLANANVQSQDLGSQTMEGVAVTGTRITSTIPAGAIGNEQPIETVSDRWFSPALQVAVKSVHNDPRIGQTTESLQNLSLVEPDASLFQVPSDYTVTEAKGPDVKTFMQKKPE